MGLDEMADLIVPVSVVIPTHNSAATIERAIRSVLVQTASPSEIVIVDDSSTDNTTAIISRLSQLTEIPVRVHRLSTNRGPSVARNIGWDVSSGDYVAFLDSDDSWHPQKLEIQTRWMLEHPDFEISGHLTGPPSQDSTFHTIDSREFSLHQFLWRNRISTPTVMVRRTATERFDVNRWHAEDYDLWIRLLCRVNQIPRIELPLAHLHKADYGESGLSSELSKMFLGELSALVSLNRRGELSPLSLVFFGFWMSGKFAVRVARSLGKRH